MQDYLLSQDVITSRDLYAKFPEEFTSKQDFWKKFLNYELPLDYEYYYSNGLPCIVKELDEQITDYFATPDEVNEQIDCYLNQDINELDTDFLLHLMENNNITNCCALLEKYHLKPSQYEDLLEMTFHPVMKTVYKYYLQNNKITTLQNKCDWLNNEIKRKEKKISVLSNIRDFLATTCFILISSNWYLYLK
jgi:hypothetical protein